MRHLARVGCLFLVLVVPVRAHASLRVPRHPQKGAVPARLELNKPIEHEWHGGGTQAYLVRVEAGQFVHVVVLQQGVDVAVTLLDPNGREVADSDSFNSAEGPERVSAIADASGDFQVKVAAGEGPGGRCEVRLTDLRAPTQADRMRMRAERTYMEGIHLFLRGDATSFKAAAEKWQASFDLWQPIDDKYEQALSLESAGIALQRLHEGGKSLDYFQRALALWRALGNRGQEAATLNNIGVEYGYLDEKQKALDCYAQALPIYRALGDRAGEAAALNNIAVAYTELGEKQRPLDYFDQARVLYRAMGDRAGEAGALSNLGWIHSRLGEMQKALDCYVQALSVSRAIGDRTGEASALQVIGLLYADLADRDKALDYYAQSLKLSRELGERNLQARALFDSGLLHADFNEHAEARDCYAQALALYRDMHNRFGEGRTLTAIGRLAFAGGDSRKAVESYAQALSISRAIGDRTNEAHTQKRMGEALVALGDKQTALDCYGEALSLLQAVQEPIGQASALLELMKYWRTEHRPALAIFFGKLAVDRFQLVRRNIQGLPAEEQRSFVSFNENSYRELADLLIGEGRLPEAQEILELLKLEEFADYSHRRRGFDLPARPVTLTRAEETAKAAGDPIETEIAAVGHEWSMLDRKASRTPDEQARYDDLSNKVAAANRQWKKYLDGLYTDFGKRGEATQRVGAAKDESRGLQNLLLGAAPGTVGLYTLVLDQKCVVMVVTPAVRVAREVPVARSALRTKVFAFVAALSGRHPEAEFLPGARDLYRLLFAPIEKDLEQAHARTLLWSLDDVLRYVPLAALHDGKQYVAERFANVVITTTGLVNLSQPQVAAWRGLAMGVSKDYEGLGALSAVPGELDAVVTSAGRQGSHGPVPGAILLDDAFTQKDMTAALDEHPPVVHVATHFVLSPGDDERSYLLLGGKDTGGKGHHLSLADLDDDVRIKLTGVELLTLSACQTGMGVSNADGREVDSLGMVAQKKGAKSVIATLWSVDDASTAALMETFYRLWTTTAGITKAEALRQAQLALLGGRYRTPFYWAPFVLIGNWK